MLSRLNPDALFSVPSALSVISAAKMLEAAHPRVSGAFACFAHALCRDFFQRNPEKETPQSQTALRELSAVCAAVGAKGLPSAKELEQFGDAIIVCADSAEHRPEMYTLAYISYCATSVGGGMTERTMRKAKGAEEKILVYFPPAQREQLQWVQAELLRAQRPVAEGAAAPKLVYPELEAAQVQRREMSEAELVQIAREALRNGSEIIAYAAVAEALRRFGA